MTNPDFTNLLAGLVELGNGKALFIESNGQPLGAFDTGDIAIAGYALATQLATQSDDMTAAMETVTRYQEHHGDAFALILYAAILDILNRQVEPSFKLLDGTSTDRRAKARKEWAAIESAANGGDDA